MVYFCKGGSPNCLLIQFIPSLTTLLEKKCFQLSRVHFILVSVDYFLYPYYFLPVQKCLAISLSSVYSTRLAGGKFPEKCKIPPAKREKKGEGKGEEGKRPPGTPYTPGARSLEYILLIIELPFLAQTFVVRGCT